MNRSPYMTAGPFAKLDRQNQETARVPFHMKGSYQQPRTCLLKSRAAGATTAKDTTTRS
jgi:hypothetical protein